MIYYYILIRAELMNGCDATNTLENTSAVLKVTSF